MINIEAILSNHRLAARVGTLAGVLGFALCVGMDVAAAQAQAKVPPGASSWDCPAGYALLNTQPAVCHSNSGDVVEPVAVHRPSAAVGCPSGYDRLEALCLSPVTGDVVLAQTPDGSHARR